MEKNSKSVIELELTASYILLWLATRTRGIYADRKGRCEGGEKAGGYFFVNNQEKTRGNRQNMNYKKLGMEGGGEVVEGTQK
jgi:hypothetical protein